MRTAKIISFIALVIQIFTAIFTETIRMNIKDIFDFVRNGDGIFPLVFLESMFFFCIPFVYLFTCSGIKTNNSVFYFLSAFVLIPSALTTPPIDSAYIFFFAVPCILLAVSAVIAKIDKQNQKVKKLK